MPASLTSPKDGGDLQIFGIPVDEAQRGVRKRPTSTIVSGVHCQRKLEELVGLWEEEDEVS